MNEPTALMTVRGSGQAPTFESVANQLGVRIEDIDQDYGIVPINLAEQLYAVQVRANSLPAGDRSPYQGPYSQPEIEAFGASGSKPKKPHDK